MGATDRRNAHLGQPVKCPHLLLYVHPQCHDGRHEHVVPAGVIAHMNALELPKLGRYGGELTGEDIAAARVLAMDAHWYLGLAAIKGLVRDAKKINPALRVMVGGYTASAFPNAFLRTHPQVDVLLRGHAEHTFGPVAQALFEDKAPPPLPGVWVQGGRDGGHGAPPDPEDNLPGRSINLSWFPSLQQHTQRAHDTLNPATDHFDHQFPYFPVIRGCRFSCGFCYGRFQEGVYGEKGPWRRQAAHLAQATQELVKQGRRFVTMVGDFLHFAPAWFVKEAFPEKLPLALHLMCCNIPPMRALAPLLEKFSFVRFEFTNPADQENHFEFNPHFNLDRKNVQSLDTLRALNERPDADVLFSLLSNRDKRLAGQVEQQGLRRIQVVDNSEWAAPFPDTRGMTPATEPRRFGQWFANSQRFQWGRVLQSLGLPEHVLAGPVMDRWGARAQHFAVVQGGPFRFRLSAPENNQPPPPVANGQPWLWPVTPRIRGGVTLKRRDALGILAFEAMPEGDSPVVSSQWVLSLEGPFTSPTPPRWWFSCPTPLAAQDMKIVMRTGEIFLETPQGQIALAPPRGIALGPGREPAQGTMKNLVLWLHDELPHALLWLENNLLFARMNQHTMMCGPPQPGGPKPWKTISGWPVFFRGSQAPDEKTVQAFFSALEKTLGQMDLINNTTPAVTSGDTAPR